MESEFTNTQDIEHSISSILKFIGENPEREGLIDTPTRIIKSWQKLFGGYLQKPEDVLQTTFQEGACQEMVILKDIEFYSTCEHHFLPFSGRISIGYLPNEKVVGISKLARLVEVFSRRLQIQERLSAQIADSIMQVLDAKGCIVICQAQHMCMTARGIEKQNAKMVTQAYRGVFNDIELRNEFIELVK